MEENRIELSLHIIDFPLRVNIWILENYLSLEWAGDCCIEKRNYDQRDQVKLCGEGIQRKRKVNSLV